jgi:UDP-N-acetylmuramoylalanine--D-glutamate ligase
MNFKNKKVLLAGLGILGGGEATAKFLAENGAKLTITDLKEEKFLKKSAGKLKKYGIKFVLGEHREKDFKENEIIVFNQAVSASSKWVKFARKNKKQIETDLTLFLKILNDKSPEAEYVAVTGTRGKTTTTSWIHHFLKPAIIGGNIPEASPPVIFKKFFKSKNNALILEIPSAQLEYFEMAKNFKPPKIAVITNLYIDHLNRHGSMDNYALAKSRIFSNQTKNDFLILNYDNKNKKYFLKQKPKAGIFYVSLYKLPKGKNGLYFDKDKIFFQGKKEKKFVAKIEKFSPHRKYNLLSALLTGYLYGKKWEEMADKVLSLPSVKFRQQIIFKNKKIAIINDSAATSPEATIAALENFGKGKDKLILITGGTDKNLEFKELVVKIKKYIKKENLYLLDGSATRKLIQKLERVKYFGENNIINFFENLKDILAKTKKDVKKGVILFSPGAASFEKFKNEFDRGKKFNELIKSIYGKYSK